MTDLDNPIDNPVPGDKLVNRRAAKHPTRTVQDRTLGGDVCYCYNLQSRYTASCTIEVWREFAQGARIIREEPRPVQFFPPPLKRPNGQ